MKRHQLYAEIRKLEAALKSTELHSWLKVVPTEYNKQNHQNKSIVLMSDHVYLDHAGQLRVKFESKHSWDFVQDSLEDNSKVDVEWSLDNDKRIKTQGRAVINQDEVILELKPKEKNDVLEYLGIKS